MSRDRGERANIARALKTVAVATEEQLQAADPTPNLRSAGFIVAGRKVPAEFEGAVALDG